LHSDGRGSVRHVTGVAGQAAGQMRYTPFGEMAEQSGATSLFGFTGEPQGGLNDLVYLRARYYNPALGRFLTQDSLIPDVTNSQALNPYAYVYNDPINLVDPSGNIPAIGGSLFPIPPISLPSRELMGAGALAGLHFLDWYQSKPENCACDDGGAYGFWGPVLGVGAHAANGVATKPAEMYGSKVVETMVSRQVERSISLRWLKNSRVMDRLPIVQTLMPEKIGLGHRTVRYWQASKPVHGTIDELVEPGMPRANGTHYTGANRRVTLNTKPQLRSGLTGFAGAAAWAAWIDGITQLASDWDLCLSPMQKANRFATSLVLGLAGGTAAGIAFIGATALVPALVATGLVASSLR
jgi:RHS repeat-associated protein